MKHIALTVLGLFALLPVTAQRQMELTAGEVAQRMMPGWNLGNTLEAGDTDKGSTLFGNGGGLATEMAWQDTKTTQEIIDFVKEQGFRSVRIPCAWVWGHMADADRYTIDAEWMARVKQVVDYCIKANLYVVLNQHWDGGWLENNIMATGAQKAKNMAVLKAVWQQIANEFRDYDERLLFAGLNEPNAETQEATDQLVEYEQEFINTVRATGGNNAQRVLIVQGPGTNIDHTCNFMTTLPTDPAPQRMMVEVHYYEPWQWWDMEKDESWGRMFYYWGQGNHVDGSLHNATIGEEDYVEEQLEKMKKQFVDKGIPVYIGEFGANWRAMPVGESQDKHNASIKAHYRTVVQKAMEKGMVPVVWDTNYRKMPSMTIIDREHLTVHNHYMLDAIREAMEAVGLAVEKKVGPQYQKQRMKLERLNRGVVAVRNGQQVVVSWRTLSTDRTDEPFDVYRNGVKLNSKPLTKGGSFFVDEQPLAADATYEVRGGGQDGRFVLKADAGDGYVAVPLQKPADGETPDGLTYTYSANDASVGDVDGDGEYEIVLKWDPSNAHDNAHDGFTGPTLFDCYRMDGTLLWRIDMGINIRSGAHYVPFIVYDLDGDGRAEFIVRTADGTRDGKGRVIGDATADYRHRAPENAQNPTPEREWAKYNKQGRPKTGRILTGPEFVTVFNGMTGEAMDTKPYTPERGNLQDWGDDYANRSDRMLAAVGYLDGVHASAIFCRGYYTRTVLAAWDWDGHELKQHWVFDTNDEGTGKDGKPQQSYAGQGNHNLRVADVDGDGCDEITYGSMAVDHDGRGLYNTGMGHGDAIHLMAFDPTTPELQVWDCHENRRDGSDFRNARTGEVIFQIPSTSDVGRAMAADIDPTNAGVEMWSTDSHGIRNIKGEVLGEAQDADDPQHNQHLRMKGRRLSINFGIWWDGDLLRELLDRGAVTKYNWETKTVDEVVRFPGIVFNNGTKSNPCLAADILGDWREEVVARTPDNSELRIFVSPIPTEYRINCLMEDIPYRLSTAAQNVGYNQPSEPGFYLGPDQSVTTFLK